MNSTENEAGSMMEVTIETNIMSPTSQVDPLNTSDNRGSSRNCSGDGAVLSTISQNIDLQLPDNSPIIINRSNDKQERKKAEKKARQARKEKDKLDLDNKKRIIVEIPSEDKENKIVPIGKMFGKTNNKILAERSNSGGGGGAVSVGKTNNKLQAERNNGGGGGGAGK